VDNWYKKVPDTYPAGDADVIDAVSDALVDPPSVGDKTAATIEVNVSLATNLNEPLKVDVAGAEFKLVEITTESVVPVANQRT